MVLTVPTNAIRVVISAEAIVTEMESVLVVDLILWETFVTIV